MAGLFIRAAALTPASFQFREESSSELPGASIHQLGALVEAAPEAIAGSGEDFVHALADFTSAGKDASHGRNARGVHACDSPSIQTFEQVIALRFAAHPQAFKNLDQVRVSFGGRACTAGLNEGGGAILIASHERDYLRGKLFEAPEGPSVREQGARAYVAE